MGDDSKKISIVAILRKKSLKEVLTRDEIEFFVTGAVLESITQAQIGAMLMAIQINGMSDGEIQDLTEAMIDSGSKMDYPDSWRGTIVGKHSTGGVGDKVSLVLVPALAACGLRVPKIAGRGLGHTGGTLDKLESIPGLRVSCSQQEVVRCVEAAGCCLVGQTSTLVPADRVLYGIRDTTATVESVPLVAGSVMSKKAVERLDALVLEVTFGKAALVKTEQDGRRLARAMIETGNRLGMRTTGVLTKMWNPLGRAVGNALEVAEAVECLNGQGPADVMEVILTLGRYLLVATNKAANEEEAFAMLEKTLHDGSARGRFIAMIRAQGVSEEDAHQVASCNTMWNVLPRAKMTTELNSPASGYITTIDAYTCGVVVRHLGAGREQPGDSIDHTVGIQLLAQAGDRLEADEAWVRIHHATPLGEEWTSLLGSALCLHGTPPTPAEISPIADIMQ